MMKSTLMYVIAKGSQFLIEAYAGGAIWSPAPHDAIQTGHAWESIEDATAQLSSAKGMIPDYTLTLTEIKLIKGPDGSWHPVSQRGN